MARRSMTAGEMTKAQGRKAIKRKRSVAPKAARRSVSSAVGQRAEIARLKRELAARNSAYSEQVEHQAATIDVLKAMSASPGDPQPVFDLIVERARDLCEAYGVTVLEFDGALIHWRAATGVSEDPKVRKAVEALYPAPATNDNPSGRAILTRQMVRIDDLESEPGLKAIYRGLTAKSLLVIPLMRGGVAIGAAAASAAGLPTVRPSC